MLIRIIAAVFAVLVSSASAGLVDDEGFSEAYVVERSIRQFYEADVIKPPEIDLAAVVLGREKQFESPEVVLARVLWSFSGDRWRTFSGQLDMSKYDLANKFELAKIRKYYLGKVRQYKDKKVTLSRKVYVKDGQSYRYVYVVTDEKGADDYFVFKTVDYEWMLTDVSMSDSEFKWFYDALKTREKDMIVTIESEEE